jgi:orotidine-5'-phosphate decarboxylase
LISEVRSLGHPLCVGIDPHLDLLPAAFRSGSMQRGDPETADAVERFGLAVVERVAGRAAIVKPQIAFFEQLGWRGVRALESIVARARETGLLVLLDAKRGDIGSTAEGYASAYLEPSSSLPADAVTLNPYLGLDTLEPFFERARRFGRGCFVLVRTSNPGAGEFQDRDVGGATLFETVAGALADASARLEGPVTGYSSLGVVVGATWPEQALRVRERLPRSLFLIPGFGHQGAGAKDAVQGFVPGPAGLEGGVVAASRSLLFPKGDDGTASGWERSFDAALHASIGELAEAVTRG